ncbi:GDP-L-fucose synthase family protein [Campylobacter devanensis]|uniref:GDP-L-fucose synthase family protein n=1 Tax=Campylobacter devanensis TaxID=3161138 RepID=UPI000A33D575|nr:GDP-L-fucose synthase [Campylobacter sp. P148]
MEKNSKIYVAGHRGTAGTAIVDTLQKRGFTNIIVRTHDELDLKNQSEVIEFFEKEKPEYVFMCAVNPCGAATKDDRADFLYENTAMQNNVIHQSYKFGVKKLIFFGSGYMYPEHAQNPLKEEMLLKEMPEYNASTFAVAKIAGTMLCEAYNMQYGTNFLTLALNNLYGTRANFDLGKARVLPALIKKFHLAKLLENNHIEQIGIELKISDKNKIMAYLNNFGISAKAVEIWGTGKVRREFIHCDDLADAAIYFMENIDFSDLAKGQSRILNTHVNVGTGIDYTIAEVAQMVRDIVGFKGGLKFNKNKPDSTMDRLMDVSKIHSLGWRHKIDLKEGISMMYDWYKNSIGGGDCLK